MSVFQAYLFSVNPYRPTDRISFFCFVSVRHVTFNRSKCLLDTHASPHQTLSDFSINRVQSSFPVVPLQFRCSSLHKHTQHPPLPFCFKIKTHDIISSCPTIFSVSVSCCGDVLCHVPKLAPFQTFIYTQHNETHGHQDPGVPCFNFSILTVHTSSPCRKNDPCAPVGLIHAETAIKSPLMGGQENTSHYGREMPVFFIPPPTHSSSLSHFLSLCLSPSFFPFSQL